MASASSPRCPATISWLAALTVCPDPAGPDVHDRLTDRAEHRLGRGEVLAGAAHHDRQRALDGPGLAAGDRRVEDPEALLVPASAASSAATSGRMVEKSMTSAPGRGVGEHAVLAGQHGPDVGRVRDHGRHHVRVPDRVGDALGAPAARLDQLVGLGRAAVVAGDLEPGLDQVGGHGPAHDAEPDESDLRHSLPSLLGTAGRRAGRAGRPGRPGARAAARPGWPRCWWWACTPG